jgi:hypothetical protein
MIHYHGTPIGGPKAERVRFLKGRHALVSFAYQEDMALVADVCADFVLDNGAFTAWRKGRPMDVPGYIRWVEKWHRHPGFTWALIPDVIDGIDADNDALLRDWPKRLRGVPIWHLHEDLARLDRLCNDWPTVALGSSGQWPTPGTTSWWGRMRQAMGVACDEQGRPRARLHGLRMLAPKIFTRLPLASADSTNAAVNSGAVYRFGMYAPPSRAQRAEAIACRVESFNSAPFWEDDEL